MATGPMCGKDGRIRVSILGVFQNVAGLTEWTRRARATITRAIDFEAPTNAAGLPIGRPCAGPVEITYEVQGYFFTDPATGIDFTSDIFDAGNTVIADYLFQKTGPTGIKAVTGLVESVTMGQRVEGMATFSATIFQSSADPVPLVT